jgi:hypothetical protein
LLGMGELRRSGGISRDEAGNGGSAGAVSDTWEK